MLTKLTKFIFCLVVLCDVATINNYDIVQGSDLKFVCTLSYNGSPVDLTGATVVTKVVDRNGTNIADVTTSSHTDPEDGETTIIIPDTTTENWSVGVYSIQSKVTLSDGTEGVADDSYVNVRYANNS